MELDEAISKREVYLDELKRLQGIAISFGLTGNRKYYQRGTISEKQWRAYKNNSEKILEVEKKLIECKNVIKKEGQQSFSDTNILLDILKEVLSDSDFVKLFSEFKRRKSGGDPIKVVFSSIDKSKEYQRIKSLKDSLLNVINDLISTRNGINKYIAENEPEINKADFLLKVKELNRCCPALVEIEKYKKIIYQRC